MTEMTTQMKFPFYGVSIKCEGEEYIQFKKKAIEIKLEIETTMERSGNIKLPIDFIDGISCIVKIEYRRLTEHFQLWFSIKSDIVQYYDDDEEDYEYINLIEHLGICQTYNTSTLPQEKYIEILMKIKYVLTKLKFDKLTSKLTMKPNKDQLYYSLFACENITMRATQCSVCYDLTNWKTSCGHSVCIRCIQDIKLKKQEDCDEGCTCKYRPCPICRADMMVRPEDA